MSTSLLISIIGAISALTVSLVSALYVSRNNIVLQTRKLKEDHYVSYIEALHGLMAANKSNEATKKYVFARDKLFIVANEEVVNKILLYEKEAVGKSNDLHNKYLTEIIKSIRKDLKIKDKNFPIIGFRKAD